MTQLRNINLHDGIGNPIGSLDGALNIHEADVHTVVINEQLYQATATTTTISVQTVVNDTSLNVANTAGFAIGDNIRIDTTAVESTLPRITAITAGAPGVLTLDRQLDNVHLVGDAVTKVYTDIALATPAIAGTLAAPQIFETGPGVGDIWHIYTITISMAHTAAGDMGKFGDLAALTNGLVLRAKIGGVYATLTNWKDSGDINNDTGNVSFPARSGGGGSYGTSAQGQLRIVTGAILRLDGTLGDKFYVYNQDDLTTLGFLKMKAQGHLEGV